MKADYLRNIFECCHGDNGLFYKDPRHTCDNGEKYNDYMKERLGEEINIPYIQQEL